MQCVSFINAAILNGSAQKLEAQAGTIRIFSLPKSTFRRQNRGGGWLLFMEDDGYFSRKGTFSFKICGVRIWWSSMKKIAITTNSRTSFVKLDRLVAEALAEMGVLDGIATIFVPHTTAGVTINENADPDVMADMEQVLDKLVPWNGGYRHFEGNTAAHAKASMMGSSAQVVVSGGKLQLGTWQSLYFCEFDGPRTREVWVKGISG
jgi:secondary thiamine-phosphate synthase enzyme